MPEPVSTIGLLYLAGYAALNIYARGGSAVSREAHAAQAAATVVVEATERSQALFGDKAAALSQLQMLAAECNEPDWDKAGASPIDIDAVINTAAIVRAIPSGFPLPEFAAEPDGSISLDWIESKNRIFSVSVNASSRLAYAWLDGSDRGHGVAQFDGKKIPLRVLEGIRDILGNGNATFWAA
jgi:hypothetical protein